MFFIRMCVLIDIYTYIHVYLDGITAEILGGSDINNS